MSIEKWIPNLASLSRLPLAWGTYFCTSKDWWLAAFFVIITSRTTDWLDGFLAFKLNARSDLGRRFLDPLGDLAESVGILAGLVFTGIISWNSLGLLAALYVVILLPVVVKRTNFASSFCEGLIQAYFTIFYATGVGIYAFRAMGIQALWLLSLIPVVVFIVLRTKRHRVENWFNLMRGRGEPSWKFPE